MNLPNYPSPEVKEFGERVASAIMNANIQKSMGGLGGCKHYDLSNFEADLHPYIEAYLEGNHDSSALMYAAMRAKELDAARLIAAPELLEVLKETLEEGIGWYDECRGDGAEELDWVIRARAAIPSTKGSNMTDAIMIERISMLTQAVDQRNI